MTDHLFKPGPALGLQEFIVALNAALKPDYNFGVLGALPLWIEYRKAVALEDISRVLKSEAHQLEIRRG